ncbi:MAG: thermonuclease family protein [Thermodesulfovibrionales bacterium]|nr:thermonuclease family protein [Thermodesulfovibrionales bacterium]
MKAIRFILISSLLLSLCPLYALELSSYSYAETNGCNYQTVFKIIDGDTLELSDATRVRLIGVDTPEIHDQRKDVQWFAAEASKKLKEWIEGKTICLKQERDKTQDVDKYGRLLRYVWKLDGFFVNAELIKQGYGFAYTKYPFQYLEDFRKYERDASENNRGLWDKKEQEKWEQEVEKNMVYAKTCGEAKSICPEDAINNIGRDKTVRFFVKKSYDSGKAVFLNSKNNFEDADNFTAVIFAADKYKFPYEPADFYRGKTVEIMGKIKEYNGRAEIILKNSKQIKIVK